MPSRDVAKRYFDALAAHDLDQAVACWRPGGVDRFVGQEEVVAPDGVREYFRTLFAAFPDFAFQIIDMTTEGQRTAVRWRAEATFAGPGRFQGFVPNGARMQIEGCDVVTVGADDLIEQNHAYLDSGDVARQLGFLPPVDSPATTGLTKLANARTKMLERMHGVDQERIGDGVWVLRGGFPKRTMNVYLIADGDGVTVFDAGISAMADAVAAAAARLGGIRRVVLGHADADHRGAAPSLPAPVYCHPADREAAESDSPFRPYWDFAKLTPQGRLLYPRLLPSWDGGAVTVAGTVQEGDEMAGFQVIDLPGHAPGLIGLYRESDGLALVSDLIYTIDSQTGRDQLPDVPHPAFNQDTEQARASILKLAARRPSAVWAGHGKPVATEVAFQLERAASVKPALTS
jgi:glyoxylase-like metal-dependent hydrolase (beta-lactamase superfamily II)/predicted ester cyclase